MNKYLEKIAQEEPAYDEYFFGKVAAHAYADEMQKIGLGTLGGAMLGGAIGGPGGALIGGYLGHRSTKKKKQQQVEAARIGTQQALQQRR